MRRDGFFFRYYWPCPPPSLFYECSLREQSFNTGGGGRNVVSDVQKNFNPPHRAQNKLPPPPLEHVPSPLGGPKNSTSPTLSFSMTTPLSLILHLFSVQDVTHLMERSVYIRKLVYPSSQTLWIPLSIYLSVALLFYNSGKHYSSQ